MRRLDFSNNSEEKKESILLLKNIQSLRLHSLNLTGNYFGPAVIKHVIDSYQGSVLFRNLRELKLRETGLSFNNQFVFFLTQCHKLQFCDLRGNYRAKMQLERFFQKIYQRYLSVSGSIEIVPLENDLRESRPVISIQ